MDYQDTKTETNGRIKLYKLQSPHWRQTYRKRCHERLKNSRDKFLHRFRNIEASEQEDAMVKCVMAEEWKRLSQEETGLPSLRGAGDADSDSMEFDNIQEGENIDEVLSLFEGIREELLAEERAILAEYEEGLCYDEAALSATLNCLTAKQLLCPVCKKASLKLNKGVLFCGCGVRVDTEQDCLSLEYVEKSMADGLRQHEGFCEGATTFSVVEQQVASMTNLMMTCHECDFMYIVV